MVLYLEQSFSFPFGPKVACVLCGFGSWKLFPSEMRIHCREDIERIIYAKGMNPIAFLVFEMNHFLCLSWWICLIHYVPHMASAS